MKTANETGDMFRQLIPSIDVSTYRRL